MVGADGFKKVAKWSAPRPEMVPQMVGAGWSVEKMVVEMVPLPCAKFLSCMNLYHIHIVRMQCCARCMIVSTTEVICTQMHFRDNFDLN